MRCTIKQGDILDEPADVLVCSANVFLNLSGGVGGELLLRYGDAMQRELRRYLGDRRLAFVQQGEVISVGACGTPYRAVLHAVAVDGFYESSAPVVESVTTKSLQMAAALGARKVALTALATGYGRMALADFARGLVPVLAREFPPVDEVVVCLRNRHDLEELSSALAELAPTGRPRVEGDSSR
jgi:O-acetyl-ADP-ribose deacetylase (regulator of RNase III)